MSPKASNPVRRSDAIERAKKRRAEAKALSEAARLEAERPKDEWDEIGAPPVFKEVDGR